MQRNSPIKYAALLSALLISTSSIPAMAQEASQPKLPTEVSNLLNKLMSKKPKAAAPTPVKADTASDPDTITTSDEALTPGEFAKSQQGPAHVKSKPKPTIIVPRPVEIGPTMPLDKAARPKTKRSMPDFVHNIYVRADYGVDSPSKIVATRFRKNSMYAGGIGYKLNKVLKADINYQFRRLNTNGTPFKNGGTSIAYMLNVYVNLMDEHSNYLVPFLVGGVGYSRNEFKNDIETRGPTTLTFSGKNRDMAWNAGAGVALILTKHISLNVSYRHVGLGKFKQVATVTGPIPISPRVRYSQGQMHIQEVTGGIIINF